MKKIAILTALLAVAPMCAFSATGAHKEPHTVVPVKKDDKNHHDIKVHEIAHKHHVQKTKDEYIKEVKAKLDETKALVETEKTKASPELFAIASLKVSVAGNWLKAIESYKDPMTRYVRSVKYALDELKMAKRSIHAKLDTNVVSDKDVAEAIDKLKKFSADLSKDKDTVTLHEENATCFAALIQAANDYIEVAAKSKGKKSFKSLTGRAKKYLKDAKKFLKAHKPHEKHNGKKRKHKEKKADVHTTTAVTTATAATTNAVVASTTKAA